MIHALTISIAQDQILIGVSSKSKAEEWSKKLKKTTMKNEIDEDTISAKRS